jgi:hypothetical protein
MLLMLMQQHFAQIAASTRSKLLAATETLLLWELLLLLQLLLQLHAAHGLQLLQNQTRIKQLTQNRNTSFTHNLRNLVDATSLFNELRIVACTKVGISINYDKVIFLSAFRAKMRGDIHSGTAFGADFRTIVDEALPILGC